jgi:hypothetical protein
MRSVAILREVHHQQPRELEQDERDEPAEQEWQTEDVRFDAIGDGHARPDEAQESEGEERIPKAAAQRALGLHWVWIGLEVGSETRKGDCEQRDSLESAQSQNAPIDRRNCAAAFQPFEPVAGSQEELNVQG